MILRSDLPPIQVIAVADEAHGNCAVNIHGDA